MKRLNPKTGEPFKRGDTREDGFRFQSYVFTIRQNGFYREQWSSPEAFERSSIRMRERVARNEHLYTKRPDPKIHKKSINPETGKHWIRGDINKANGKIFVKYQGRVSVETNMYLELWAISEDSFKKIYIRNNLVKVRKKCIDKNLPYDVDNKYLLSIFPKDNMCPALKIPMRFGGDKDHRHNSPSIDRIIPAKGYVKGNVRWVSYLANAIMNEANADQILKVGKWLEEQGKLERNPRGDE